jgi:hypothetical protein
MNTNDPLRKCDRCKITKAKSLFYKYKYCKRCHIKNYINNHLCNARIANHLNLSIDELNNIMKIDTNDPTKNDIGEHERYDELILYFTRQSITGTIITNDVIDNFLDENIVPI